MKVTDYFEVRRSRRRPENLVKAEEKHNLELLIRNQSSTDLVVSTFEGKGRGVVANRAFSKGEFVVEYVGDLINVQEARKREKLYQEDSNAGCYMYYFKYNDVHYW